MRGALRKFALRHRFVRILLIAEEEGEEGEEDEAEVAADAAEAGGGDGGPEIDEEYIAALTEEDCTEKEEENEEEAVGNLAGW